MKTKNVLKDIPRINTELSKTENTKYSTVNGVKEFICDGDGYVDNIYIEGETLVNLCLMSDIDIKTPDSSYFVKENVVLANGLKPGDIITIAVWTLPKSDHKPTSTNGSPMSISLGGRTSGDAWAARWFYPDGDIKPFIIEKIALPDDYYCENSSVPIISEYNRGSSFNAKIVILKGDYTNRDIPYFKGITSIGQGNKIEILNYDSPIKINFKTTWETGKYIDRLTGEEIAADQSINLSDYIPIESNTLYGFMNVRWDLVYYDINKKHIPMEYVDNTIGTNSLGHMIEISPSNSKFVRLLCDNRNIDRTSIFTFKKYDKKNIPLTLRGIEGKNKDIVRKQGDKYYKYETYSEVKFTGKENWTLSATKNNILRFSLAFEGHSSWWSHCNGLCDLFEPVIGTQYDNDKELVTCDSKYWFINISKYKLSTTDVSGFKEWLSKNNVTIVYALRTFKNKELLNFNPQTFNNSLLSINSTGIIPELEFEVTNSLENELEILKNKLSNLEEYVLDCGISNLNNRGIFYPTNYSQGIFDLNNYRNNGTYRFYGNKSGQNGFTTLNTPNGYSNSELWVLVVTGDVQTITSYRYTNDTFIRIYRYDTKTWTSWQKITTTATQSLMEQQIAELELQAMEREV